MNNLIERSLQLFHFLSTQTFWNKCPFIWSLQSHSLFQETKNWFISRECQVSTTNSTGTNVCSFFPFLCHSAGPVLASSFSSGNKLSLPSRDATHRLNNKTIHVAGKKLKKASFWHLLGILSHIFSTGLVFMVKKMRCHHELHLSQVF